ncbi:hypothetical protein GGX14DRAFT_658293 [Mycena pura]|uniref:Uncharacterized protein n=1 Tax=Mycena pura TaxID=153505 RepID=A0AAD7E1E1_9AGAR|nr:hypothetical protein GGX14DRAFT_658293 [Mycena pura]
MAAGRVPDEIVSEILTPLLKHADEAFSDTSEKPFLAPGYSSSSYLLVCKAWLRVSTPLLYKVVILRTTSQALALAKVLKSYPEFGSFIRKLRVEGGFGAAMGSILKCATNLTEIFLTLVIHGSDNVNGLCSGLSLINPRHVILVDRADSYTNRGVKQNKNVEQLLQALTELIFEKKTVDFPYWHPYHLSSVLDVRATALASALAKSRSLETLIVYAGGEFPQYLLRIIESPSFKSLEFKSSRRHFGMNMSFILEKHPKLKSVAKFPDALFEKVCNSSASASHEKFYHVRELDTLGQSSGHTLQKLHVMCHDGWGIAATRPKLDPSIFSPFIALTHLIWGVDKYRKFAQPSPGFSALPNLQTLELRMANGSAVDVFSSFNLQSLENLVLRPVRAKHVNFLRRHGAKLLHLDGPISSPEFNLFDVCTKLETFKAYGPLPADFFSCSAPHTSLSMITFDIPFLKPAQASMMADTCAALDPQRFPALKEVKIHALTWPTTE